ncbi:MAG: 2-oxo acid dehydrogenase subunit E2, partial [Nitrospinota bacterium]|nr:2-oxo acid dehydrogenase subunit E2 [Nitrospinota bacterium]
DIAEAPHAPVIDHGKKGKGAPEKIPPTSEPAASDGLIAAAPSVRRLAREMGINIRDIPGTGPRGRISAKDVNAYAQRHATIDSPPSPGSVPPSPPLPDFSNWGPVERVAMEGGRRATARQMSLAWSQIPHVTQFDKADITELEKLRKRYAAKAEAAGGKLTITAILLKVVASALKVFPKFNASLDLNAGEVVHKKYCHIGVAVDTDRGLLVPVIRDVDKKNIMELAVELTGAGERARERKIKLEEMQGGSFTITNLGGIGGTYFTPIVNWPEVAILGVSRGGQEPVYIEGTFQPRLKLPLQLSYDHRLIDGADGIRFLRWIAEALENPFLLPLEG